MAKTLIVANRTTDLAAGGFTFDITDPTNFKTLKMDRGRECRVQIVRETYDQEDWEPVLDKNGDEIWLDRKRRTATLTEIGTYSLRGAVAGTPTFWTQDNT